ncbi:hypothetical protein KQX54_011626 [Cotesia glomerata]|uniref:Uncharacterized protein n=1 Tax=Cotesia glomerata TaxID=32391 RepID=A0AAV7IMS3_COTGL|nr:hypothetical protein KQX54_011626 [Cotesia glomerata]
MVGEDFTRCRRGGYNASCLVKVRNEQSNTSKENEPVVSTRRCNVMGNASRVWGTRNRSGRIPCAMYSIELFLADSWLHASADIEAPVVVPDKEEEGEWSEVSCMKERDREYLPRVTKYELILVWGWVLVSAA